MIKLIKYLLLIFITSSSMNGQTTSLYLKKVYENHPGIIAGRELLNSKEAETRTGLTPENPVISGGYFPGKPVEIGDKTTWSITQSLDFPTKYSKLKALKKTNFDLAALEFESYSLMLMTEARDYTIRLVNDRENLTLMQKRLNHFQSLEIAYRKMLEKGESTIIEYNKVMIRLANIRSIVSELENSISSNLMILDYFSNGSSGLLENADYPLFGDLHPDSLFFEKGSSHPAYLIPGTRIDASRKNIQLSKTGNLPGIDLGYGSESVGGEAFTGPSLGITIPIWKNRGKVKAAEAETGFMVAEAEREILLLKSELTDNIRSCKAVKTNLDEIIKTVDQSDNRIFLKDALEAGEISMGNYIIELTAYYEIEDTMITLEKRYYLLLSMIFDHRFPGIF